MHTNTPTHKHIYTEKKTQKHTHTQTNTHRQTNREIDRFTKKKKKKKRDRSVLDWNDRYLWVRAAILERFVEKCEA